ncbi:MAG: AI-2E family transporter [Terriglobia bacterium]
MSKTGSAREDGVSNRVSEGYRRAAIFAWALIGLLILVAAAMFLIYHFRSTFALFVYSVAIVYALRPAVNIIEGWRIPRVLAVLVTYVLLIVVLTLVTIFFVPVLVDQIQQFSEELPGYVRDAIRLSQEYVGVLEQLSIPPEASKVMDQGLDSVKSASLGLIAKVPKLTVDLLTTLVYFLLAPIIAFYILKDLQPIKENLKRLTPRRHREELNTILTKVDTVVGGFLRGQLVVAIIVGILSSIALSLLGVNFPVVIGTTAGLLNVIPYLGPIVASVLAALVAVFQSPILAAEAVLVLLVIQQVDGMFISPHVVGSQVNLHPVVIIFSLLIGGSVMGLLGMILAIPVAAAAKALLWHFREKSDLADQAEETA